MTEEYRGYDIEIEQDKLAESPRERIEENLRQEVEIYDMFLTGNVWYFIIEKNGKHIDSCSEWYGDPEESGLMDECRSIIDDDIKKEREKHAEKLKKQIRNNVPLTYRSVL